MPRRSISRSGCVRPTEPVCGYKTKYWFPLDYKGTTTTTMPKRSRSRSVARKPVPSVSVVASKSKSKSKKRTAVSKSKSRSKSRGLRTKLARSIVRRAASHSRSTRRPLIIPVDALAKKISEDLLEDDDNMGGRFELDRPDMRKLYVAKYVAKHLRRPRFDKFSVATKTSASKDIQKKVDALIEKNLYSDSDDE